MLARHREDDAKQSAAQKANCRQQADKKFHIKNKKLFSPKTC
jgi:hypothetical protein